MTFQQELASWAVPEALETSPVPEVGQSAPSSEQLAFPRPNTKPAIVTFLRHCGCPFAEKTFRAVRSAAAANPGIDFIAVSHSDQPSTDKWLESVGGSGDVSIVVDSNRAIYAKWGLGASTLAHFLSPFSMWSVFKLGREEGIWNRPTETGSRWQQAGTWAIDTTGTIKWGGPASRADDIPDIDSAVGAISDK